MSAEAGIDHIEAGEGSVSAPLAKERLPLVLRHCCPLR